MGNLRHIPDDIALPEYVKNPKIFGVTKIQIHKKESIKRMRKSCRIARSILFQLKDMVKPGVTTEEIDEACFELHMKEKCYPSPLGYSGYPKSVCISVNDVACHGIPDKRVLKSGDIVNIDVTTYTEGVHGDTSMTFPVGEISAEDKNLIKTTEEAMMMGINQIKPFSCVSEIGQSIEKFWGGRKGIIKEFTGHGIGQTFHSEPAVFHFHNPNYKLKLLPGMTLTVEPIMTYGSEEVYFLPDKWTVMTKDHSNTAQFEHTVLVTDTGFEILTVDP